MIKIKKDILTTTELISELRDRIAELEAKNAEQSKELESLKAGLKSKGTEREMPDDVRDIPLTISADDYNKKEDWRVIWIADSLLNVMKRHIDEDAINAWDDIRISQHIAFPTEEYAKMYREKCQLIANMLHFKWLYDREYVPNWNDENECKYFVGLNHSVGFFDTTYTFFFDYGAVFFSSMEKAKKCAEWLNYLYKKGKYAE